MNSQTRQIKFLLTYFLLFTFLVCGVGGLFCAMPVSASDTQPSHPTSHHSSSQDSECPDQFKNSKKESQRFSVVLLQGETLETLGSWSDLFQSRNFKKLFKALALTPTSYPLLFLRFSSLLNWVPKQPSSLRIQKCVLFLGLSWTCSQFHHLWAQNMRTNSY